jgi:hypothetical protein
MKLHNKHFLERQEISSKISYGLMEKMFESKKIGSFSNAKLDEDKKGIDFFITWKNKDSSDKYKVQFKNRQDNFQDIPVCRFQPFYGVGNSKTVMGRDYKALINKENDYYFTAVKGKSGNYEEVLIVSSSVLLKRLQEAEKEWFGSNPLWENFDATWCDKTTQWNKKLLTASNGVEAWFKRTAKEKAAKINLYVPKRYAEDLFQVK